jgi:RimJ/RimL family protein N-acetyltransferase
VSDCDLLWKWVNDPVVRAAAFCSDYISIEEHRRWFYGKLADPQCLLFVGVNGDGAPIGQVRFDVRDSEAEVDVSVAPNCRGHGYGVGLIRKGVQALRQEISVSAIQAFVKLENRASLQAFLNAGFICHGVEIVKGQSALRLTWSRNE